MSDFQDSLNGTLRSFFETVYRRHRLSGKGARSPHNFRTQINHVRDCLKREPLLSDLSDELLIDCMQWQLDRGRSLATANKVHAHITAIWNFAARKGLTGNVFPTLRRFDEPERTPRAWTELQLRTLFATLENVPGSICGLPYNEWHVCHHLAIWYSAERLWASLQIRLVDVDLTTGWFRIRGETRKNRTRDLVRRLPAEVLPRFRRFVEHDPARKLLFPIDCCYETVFNRYKIALRMAGLPCDRESMYHRMRRSAISHFKRLGGNGTELADHSSPAVTRRSYEDPTITGEQQAADLLFLPLPIYSDPPRAA